MNIKDSRKRLLAAEKLLRGNTTTRKKIKYIHKLTKGIDPRVDKILSDLSKTLSKIEKIKKKKVIDLTLKHLPAKTEKQKKRKKLLLLFFKKWKQLKREVKRVKTELESQSQSQQQPSSTSKTSSLGKIAARAKGPLGALTIVAAVAAVAIIALQKFSVTILITNDGCDTITPQVNIPVSIPGLKFPSQPIPDGGQAVAEVPPFNVTVDGSSARAIQLRAYGMSFNFQLQSAGTDVIFNGESLLGKRTQIRLGSKPQHQVILRCTNPLPLAR